MHEGNRHEGRIQEGRMHEGHMHEGRMHEGRMHEGQRCEGHMHQGRMHEEYKHGATWHAIHLIRYIHMHGALLQQRMYLRHVPVPCRRQQPQGGQGEGPKRMGSCRRQLYEPRPPPPASVHFSTGIRHGAVAAPTVVEPLALKPATGKRQWGHMIAFSCGSVRPP